MSRTISSAGREALYAPQTNTAFLELMIIKDSSGTPLARITNNNQIVTFDGNDYSPVAFSAKLPKDSEDEIQSANITIGNVDRSIMISLRQLTGVPLLEYFVVRSDDLSAVELGPWNYSLEKIKYDALTITATATYNTYMSTNASLVRYSTENFPGVAPT